MELFSLSITEVGQRWGLTPLQVLRVALDRKLRLVYRREVSGRYKRIQHNELVEIYRCGGVSCRSEYKRGGYQGFWLSLEALFITRDELDRFEREIGIAKKPTGQATAIERETLLKIILGMAIAAYQFDPVAQRNTATGNNRGSISADLERVGLPVDSDTVRKYLTEAVECFSDKLPVNRHKT